MPSVDDYKGSVWWKDLLALVPDFKDCSHCLPRNGPSIYFWFDAWEVDWFRLHFSRLFSSINKNILLQVFATVNDPIEALSFYYAPF